MNRAEVNSRGTNKLIKYNILSDEKMKEIGFQKNYHEGTERETYSPYWWFTKNIEFPKDKRYRFFCLTFQVQIPKDGSDICIDVINEDFLQSYDYQHMLSNNPNFEPALIIREQVEKWMKYLQDNGVLSGHEPNDYI